MAWFRKLYTWNLLSLYAGSPLVGKEPIKLITSSDLLELSMLPLGRRHEPNGSTESASLIRCRMSLARICPWRL